jgi:hypothetical protein
MLHKPSFQELGDKRKFWAGNFELQHTIKNRNKKFKHIALDDLINAYTIVPLSGRSIQARQSFNGDGG